MLLRPNDELKGIWVGYARMSKQEKKSLLRPPQPLIFFRTKWLCPEVYAVGKNKTKTTPMQNGLTAYRKGIQGAPWGHLVAVHVHKHQTDPSSALAWNFVAISLNPQTFVILEKPCRWPRPKKETGHGGWGRLLQEGEKRGWGSQTCPVNSSTGLGVSSQPYKRKATATLRQLLYQQERRDFTL